LKTERSRALFQLGKTYIPGGVNSPVRAFNGVGGDPLFIQRAYGSKILDVDGNEYIDYLSSWGPLILGHAHPKLTASLNMAIEAGTSYGAPTELEVVLARMITEAVPSIQMVRCVNSGTEATMSAIRVARGYTGRDLILKFEGCYHGHVDALLARAGSGALTLSIPDSVGVPVEHAKTTLVAPFNDLRAVNYLFQTYPDQIAAIIVEPIAANMGVVPPSTGFLEGLRQTADASGALLIFDEIVTGFRVAYGGAQSLYGVIPDITCLGKIIGGGLPVGAYGGAAPIMEMVAPLGPVYQAGTLSGNPVAMTAGIETLKILQEPAVYQRLEEMSCRLAKGLLQAAKQVHIPIQINRVGSLMTMFFNDGPVQGYASTQLSNTKQYSSFFHRMLLRGVYLAPSQYEAIFLSLAHSNHDIDATIDAAQDSFLQLTHQRE
jgi:glutamate-1-semialdehyde 2,1-aminomutase